MCSSDLLECAEATKIKAGDRITVDPVGGRIENKTQGVTYPCVPIPAHLLEMVQDGGLIPHLEKKLAARRRHA